MVIGNAISIGSRASGAASLILILSACQPAPEDVDVAPRAFHQTLEEVDFVRATFNDIQPVSIERDREYCGYIYVSSEGALSATEARRGSASSCRPRWPGRGAEVLASYHTHAAYNPEYDSEVPSYDDMASDILEAVDGYVATPGGRVWYIDATRKEARLVCGTGCVTSDPDFEPDPSAFVRDRYSLADLALREE